MSNVNDRDAAFLALQSRFVEATKLAREAVDFMLALDELRGRCDSDLDDTISVARQAAHRNVKRLLAMVADVDTELDRTSF